MVTSTTSTTTTTTTAGTGGTKDNGAGLTGTPPTVPHRTPRKHLPEPEPQTPQKQRPTGNQPCLQPSKRKRKSSTSKETEYPANEEDISEGEKGEDDEEEEAADAAEEEAPEEESSSEDEDFEPEDAATQRKKNKKRKRESKQKKPTGKKKSPTPKGKAAGRQRTSDRDFWTGPAASQKKKLLLELMSKHQGTKLEGKTKGSKACWFNSSNVRMEFNAEAKQRGWALLNEHQLRSRRRGLKKEAKALKKKFPQEFEAGQIPPSVCSYGNLLADVFGRDPSILLEPEESGAHCSSESEEEQNEAEDNTQEPADPNEEEKDKSPKAEPKEKTKKQLRSNPQSFTTGKRGLSSPSGKQTTTSSMAVGEQLGKLAQVATSLFQASFAPPTPGESPSKSPSEPKSTTSLTLSRPPSSSSRPAWIGTITQATWNILEENAIDEEAFHLLEPEDIAALPIPMGDKKKLIARLGSITMAASGAAPFPPQSFSSVISPNVHSDSNPALSLTFSSASPMPPPPPPPPPMNTSAASHGAVFSFGTEDEGACLSASSQDICPC